MKKKKLKHGSNPSLKNYIDVHEKTLRKYVSGFGDTGTRDFYDLDFSDRNSLKLIHDNLRFQTKKGTLVKIEIYKVVTFRPDRTNARTITYKYHAYSRGGYLLGYESPDYFINHPTPQEHHKFHHKHVMCTVFFRVGQNLKI